MSQTQTLDEYIRRLSGLPEDELNTLYTTSKDIVGDPLWVPNPGPQTAAFFCPADMLLYGGQGGGGKTDLLCGLALTAHKNSLLMRPQYTDLGGLTERVVAITGSRVGLNSSPPPQYKFIDGRVIDFGAAQTQEKAETWQGRPHDLNGFDEAALFVEAVIRFVIGWNRAADQELGVKSTQRTRVVLASNPPITNQGAWIIGMFRPWLDITHPNPAEPGELRWFITDDNGKDLEVDGPDDIKEYDGKQYTPESRTFIPAALRDNPYLVNTKYQATLDAMPEPMRSAIRDGNFMAAREDDAFQVIPTNWVLQANARWHLMNGEPTQPMSAVGCDVARGGRDQTVLAPRYGRFFDKLTRVPGRDTPDGPAVAALCAGMLREGAIIGVDNIGVGADAETSLKNAGLPFQALNGSASSFGATRDGAFVFWNLRTEMWWMLREALDPEYGYDVALPPDPALQEALTAPVYEVRPGEPPKIYVQSKLDLIKLLGRSPDDGDAVVYAWAAGEMDAKLTPAAAHKRGLNRNPPAVTKYDAKRH